MSTYVVTHDGSRFEVREGDKSGQVVATFSNKLAAETFAEKKRMADKRGRGAVARQETHHVTRTFRVRSAP